MRDNKHNFTIYSANKDIEDIHIIKEQDMFHARVIYNITDILNIFKKIKYYIHTCINFLTLFFLLKR